MKIDTLDNRPISEAILENLIQSVKQTSADSVAFCDFRHGIFSRINAPLLTKAIPSNVFSVADSQVASRWGNITEFKGFDLITPNERESRFSLADQDSTIGGLAGLLNGRAKNKNLILNLLILISHYKYPL